MVKVEYVDFGKCEGTDIFLSGRSELKKAAYQHVPEFAEAIYMA